MKKRIVSTLAVAALSCSGFAAHFTYQTVGEGNIPFVIETDVKPTLDGIALEVGDEIGLFTPAGLCAGGFVWDGGNENVTFNAYSDNSMTPDEIEGMQAGETVYFKIYDKSADTEYDAVAAAVDYNNVPVANITYPGVFYILKSLEAVTPVIITEDPANLSLLRGETATFTVTASGGINPVYQWQKDGVNIPGATSATYTIDVVMLGDAGKYRCTVADANSGASSSEATLTVTNQVPTLTEVTAQTISEDTPLEITLGMTDAADLDEDALSLIIGTGDNYTVNGVTITPTPNWSGELSVPVQVTDGIDPSAQVTMKVTVEAENDAPTLTSVTPQEINESSSLTLLLSMTDGADVDNSLTDASLVIETGDNYTVDGATITPTAGWSGELVIPVKVTDGVLTSAAVDLVLTVNAVNDAPTLTNCSEQTIKEDESLTVLLSMTDGADVDNTLSDASIVLAAGDNYTFDGTTVTPTANWSGILEVPVAVTDGEKTSDPVTMKVIVEPENDAPTLTNAAEQSIDENGSLTVLLSMTDGADVDNTLTDESVIVEAGDNYTVEGNTVTPTAGWSGTLTVPVKVTDGTLTTEAVNMNVIVSSFNDAPTLTTCTPQSIAEDGSLTVLLSMTDGADVDNTLSDASIVVGTGDNYTVDGTTVTPTANWSGTLTVPVTVTDGEKSSASVNMSVEVTAENDEPETVGSINDTITQVDEEYTLDVPATLFNDVDGEALVLTVTGLPAGLTFNGTTISGIPTELGAFEVTVTATDAADATADVVFVITVDKKTAILDSDKNQVLPLFVTPNPVMQHSEKVTFHMPDTQGEGVLSIFDVQGNLLNRQDVQVNDNSSCIWDLRNRSGQKVASGSYVVILKVKDIHGKSELYKTMVGVKK